MLQIEVEVLGIVVYVGSTKDWDADGQNIRLRDTRSEVDAKSTRTTQ